MHRDPVTPTDDRRIPGAESAYGTGPVRTVDSRSLFRGEHEIGIEHQGSLYRLKITRQGKLILNK